MSFTRAAVFEPKASLRQKLVKGLAAAGLEASAAQAPEALAKEQLVVLGPGLPQPGKVARAVRKARPDALLLAATPAVKGKVAKAGWADAVLPLPLSAPDLRVRLPELAALAKAKKAARSKPSTREAAPPPSAGILDPRTHFYTFAHFKEVLFVEVKRARRYGFPLSLALLAFDPLKVEQSPSLRAQLLGGLSLAVRRSLRDTDFPVQYGERRVLLLMPHTPLSGAVVVAQRIRERVAKATLTLDGQVLRPTISAGLAGFSPGPRELSFADLARQAQKSLLSASKMGGNRVEFFDAGDLAAQDPALAALDFEPTRY
jgi:diguanylate cyclase (GGDEF)-like protein